MPSLAPESVKETVPKVIAGGSFCGLTVMANVRSLTTAAGAVGHVELEPVGSRLAAAVRVAQPPGPNVGLSEGLARDQFLPDWRVPLLLASSHRVPF